MDLFLFYATCLVLGALPLLQRARVRALHGVAASPRRAPAPPPGEGGAAQLVSPVARLADERTPIQVGRLAFTTALNLLSSTIFSIDLADLDDDNHAAVEFKAVLAEANKAVGLPNLSDFFPEVAWLDLQGLRRYIEGLFLRLHTMIDDDDQIERRLWERAATDGNPDRKNFMDVLLDLPRHR